MNVEPLFASAAAGDLPALTSLLESEPAGASATNSQGISLLMWAMYHRQPEAGKIIYRHLDNPGADEAVAVGDVETLRAALTADASLIGQYSSDGFTLLHYACFFAQADCVRLLLDRGSEVNCAARNPSQVYPIHSAAAAQAVNIVSLLLQTGADPNVQQVGGFTPLMSAAAHNHHELVSLLLANNADKRLRDDEGNSAYDHGNSKGFEIAVLAV